MTKFFTERFDRYVNEGETITCTIDGFDLIATVYHDDDSSPPWERDDGHGPVSEWTTRDKSPGERVLSSDRSHHRYYSFQEACKIALKDGWGVKGGRKQGETKKAYAARAAEHDFNELKAWCNDEWHYCGIAVTASKNGVELVGKYDHALWGIEANYPDSDNAYISDTADELADEALEAAKDKLATICVARS